MPPIDEESAVGGGFGNASESFRRKLHRRKKASKTNRMFLLLLHETFYILNKRLSIHCIGQVGSPTDVGNAQDMLPGHSDDELSESQTADLSSIGSDNDADQRSNAST